MALKKCRECGHSVSTRATACPSCGSPIKKSTKVGGCGCLLILLVAILVGAAIIESRRTPEEKAQRAAQQAADEKAAQRKQVPTPAPPKEPPPAKTVVARLQAAQLLTEYNGNEIGADQRYKGKWIEVTGIVNHVGRDILDYQYVTLRGDNEFAIFTVQCYFRKNWNLGNISPGSIMTIRGSCDGKFGNVALKDCEQ